MKKVLALVVAVALVFTTLTCCFVTSAAATDITLAAESVTVDSASAADVAVTGTLAAEADFVAFLTITIKEGFTFNGIDGLEPYDAEAEAAAEEAGEDYDFDYVKDVVDGVTTIKSLKVHENEFTYAINVTAPANDTCAAVTYEDVVVVDAEYAAWDDDVVSTASAEADVTVNAGADHDYVGVIDPDATCTDEGVETFTCSVCGDTYTEAISAKGHTEVEVPAVEATCTETGLTAGTKCSVCDAVIVAQEVVEALGHTEGEPVEENRVEAQPGVAGSYDTVVYCTVCKAELSRTTTEIPALPEEPAGPVVDENLVVAGASVGFGTSSLQVNFRIRKTVIQLYDKVDLVIIPEKYDSATYNLVAEPEEIVPTLTLNGVFYTYTYTDINLYELGLNIDYILRAYDAKGNLVAVSETFTTSPAAYLKTSFASSTDAKFRTLATDTLIVGQKAVEMMAASNPDTDLARATSIIEGFDISEASETYGTPNDVDTFNSYATGFGTDTSSTHQVRKSVSVDRKVPYIGFRIKDAKSALDVSKISYRVTYTSVDLSGNVSDYDETFTGATKAGQFITFSFDEIGLGDSNKDLFVEIIYDGTVVCDMTYSIETYLSGMTSNASVGDLATALLKLGASFRTYSGQ